MTVEAPAPPGRLAAPPPVGPERRYMRLSQSTRESLVAAVVALGGLAVVYMWWHDTSVASVQGPGAWLTAAGRVTGLVGTYLVVVEVLLMARAPWLDRLIGTDRLALWHRRNGEYSITLLLAHALLTIWGYAVTTHTGLLHETSSVVMTYPDMLAATVGLGLFVLIGVLSARAVRRRVRYHTWYFIHLYTYVALALSFSHQLSTGVDFALHPLNRALWVAMYVLVGLVLVTYRVVVPLVSMARHRFRVVGTVDEAPGVTSVYITGRRLGELRAEAGQFFMWRFLTRDGWWQAHPFSLSAAPNGNWLRITVKALGDHSATLSRLAPGTLVLAEGPYGAFTRHRRRQRRMLLIGAGVGVTPLRALFEAAPARPGDISFIYRADDPAHLALRDELDEIAAKRRAEVHYVLGDRALHPELLSTGHILSLVRDVARRDVYVCGPPGFTGAVVGSLREAGVPNAQIHTESFEF